MLNDLASIAILIVVLALAAVITCRAIEQGKVGPQFGLRLQPFNPFLFEITGKQIAILFAIVLSFGAAFDIYVRGISFAQLLIYAAMLIVICALIACREDQH